MAQTTAADQSSARISPVMLDWFRTFLIIATTIGGLFLAYGRLDARAAAAVTTAGEAKDLAVKVEKEVRDTKEKFIEAVANLASDVRVVRVLLDERLPKPVPSLMPTAGPR